MGPLRVSFAWQGCEVGFVRDLERAGRSGQRLGQIQMEVHKLNNVPQAMELLARLEAAGYRMFHAGMPVHSSSTQFLHPLHALH